jgi:hypothetical protein
MSGSRGTRWLGWWLATMMGAGALADEFRLNDVFYLDEAGMRAIPLKVLGPAPMTFSRDPSPVLHTLRAGQMVYLIGYCERRYYVEMRLMLGTARGWVDVAALEPLSLEQRAVLDQQRERAKLIKAAIARHEVLLGMTQPEVLAALGPPAEKSGSTTAQGSEETWNYVAYRSEPYTQTAFVNGYYVTQTLTRKVVSGGKEIVFRNGVVTAIRAKEGNASQPDTAPPMVVPVPVPIIVPTPTPPKPPTPPTPPPPKVLPAPKVQ